MGPGKLAELRPALLGKEGTGFWVCLRQLTLYLPAGFLAGLPSFEVVGVALAAPIHELAAALSVPAVVKTGDQGAAGPHLRGQEADLRVVSYGRGRTVGEREGGQPHLQGGRGFREQRGLYKESTLWGARALSHGRDLGKDSGWGTPSHPGQEEEGGAVWGDT